VAHKAQASSPPVWQTVEGAYDLEIMPARDTMHCAINGTFFLTRSVLRIIRDTPNEQVHRSTRHLISAV
jgi:hypothetical protein